MTYRTSPQKSMAERHAHVAQWRKRIANTYTPTGNFTVAKSELIQVIDVIAELLEEIEEVRAESTVDRG